MLRRITPLVVIVFSIISTALFYKQSPGLNLVITESLFIFWILISKKYQPKGLYAITLGICVVTSLAFTIVTHSVFSYSIHYIVLFVFIGYIAYPETKSYYLAFGHAFANVIRSPIIFLKQVLGSKTKGRHFGKFIWKMRIFIIPIAIILIFILMYSNSNPVFGKIVTNIETHLSKWLEHIFKNFNFSLIITFFLCLYYGIFLFITEPYTQLVTYNSGMNESLTRNKKNRTTVYSTIALKNEYKAGIFLFTTLNIILLVLNIIDIKWVWFGFEWEGQYLKQFVHEGTYLLILSILISIALVLYYFRGNLNFYTKNKWLKILSYIWVGQNAVLTLSVAIRNFWYIRYFALAYKRIGVIIFLILTIYGLYTVFMKVSQRKSVFHLLKANSYCWIAVLTISSVINWDSIIARYNFKHSDKSFLHLNFMATLSDKALPYLDLSLKELYFIEDIQKEKFPFEQKFMTPDKYHSVIEKRKQAFKTKWEAKSLRSWNLPEYLAYKKLFIETSEKQPQD